MTHLTEKQRVIVEYLLCKETTIDVPTAVGLIGKDVYHNENFHVGNVLRRMEKRGFLRRVKRGVYELVEENA